MPDKLTSLQEEILSGTLLGDACLFLPNNGNPYISIKRRLEDRKYLEWQASFFKEFTGRPVHEITYMSSKIDKSTLNKVRYKYTAIEFISRRSKAFLRLRDKWYNNRKKIIPRDLQLTPIILAEWFCDDGCVSIRNNKKSIKLELATMGFYYDDIDFLKRLLELKFKEKFCISKNKVLYCSDVPARLFLKYIDNVFPPGMERKIIWKDSNIEFYTKKIGQSLLKRQEELKIKINDFLILNKEFSMFELAQYTNCLYMHNDKLEPKYYILNKYLQPYIQNNIIKKNKNLWVVNPDNFQI